MAKIDLLLYRVVELGASDLHLKSGWRPRIRLDGNLCELDDLPPLSHRDVRELLLDLLNGEQKRQFEDAQEQDLSYGTDELGRFRCNLFHDNNGPAGSFRRIPGEIPTLAGLKLPSSLENLVDLHSGLVLVSGATGSGKSSTLAALIDVINERHSRSIITLEDPIEYVHLSKSSLIHQRALGTDFMNFSSGIKASLRQNPDILMVGEMRDLDTMRMTLTAVETGLLVFSTLHSNTASSAIDRIIDVFPVEEQSQSRSILAEALEAVVCQILLPRRDQAGQVPATEVLMITPAISNLIREGKTRDLPTQLQTGKQFGMQTMDDSLEALYRSGLIEGSTALRHSANPARFEDLGIR